MYKRIPPYKLLCIEKENDTKSSLPFPHLPTSKSELETSITFLLMRVMLISRKKNNMRTVPLCWLELKTAVKMFLVQNKTDIGNL